MTSTNKTPPIPGGPFNIVLLNRIFAFSAETAGDAIHQLGMVCRQWRETEEMFGAEMWERLYEEKFGQFAVRGGGGGGGGGAASVAAASSSTIATTDLRRRKNAPSPPSTTNIVPDVPPPPPPPGGNRVSRFHYQRRAVTKAAQLFDIEGCGGGRERKENANDGDDATAAAAQEQNQFTFRCPLVAQNLISTSKKHPSNGLPILFCHICERNVMPVTTQEEFKEASQNGLCVQISGKARMAFTNSVSERFNIAIVTTMGEQQSSKDDATITNTCAFGPAEECLRSAAMRMSKSLMTKMQTERKRGIDAMKHLADVSQARREKEAEEKKKQQRTLSTTTADDDASFEQVSSLFIRRKPMMEERFGFERDPFGVLSPLPSVAGLGEEEFLTRNMFITTVSSGSFSFGNGDATIALYIIRVPPKPENFDVKATPEKHPASEDGPLGNKNMPASGGWNFVACVDRGAAAWFCDSSSHKNKKKEEKEEGDDGNNNKPSWLMKASTTAVPRHCPIEALIVADDVQLLDPPGPDAVQPTTMARVDDEDDNSSDDDGLSNNAATPVLHKPKKLHRGAKTVADVVVKRAHSFAMDHCSFSRAPMMGSVAYLPNRTPGPNFQNVANNFTITKKKITKNTA